MFLTVGSLLPYWPSFSVVLATDDSFTSDIFNGELPGRVLVEQGLRARHLHLWTNALCSGAAENAFLLPTDVYYPGWTTVVGMETPIYRANVSVRGIALPKGDHTVRFTDAWAPFTRGLRRSGAALLALTAWFGEAWYGARR